MRPNVRPSRGFILPLGMILSVALLALGFALSNMARFQLLLAQTKVRGEQAQAAADGGLVVAMNGITASQTYTGTTGAVNVSTKGPETYQVTVYKAGSSLPDGRTVPSSCVYLLCTGRAGRATRQTGGMVQLGTGSTGFKGLRGILGTSVYLNNGAYVNSYNSLKGYKQLGSNGSVATNSAGAGSVRLLGGSNVFGPIALGPKSTVEAKPTAYNVGGIYTLWHDWGTSYGATTVMDTPVDTPAVSMPAVGTTDLSLNSKSTELDPGAYRDVTISNGARLTLEPGTYVFRSLSLQGGAKIDVSGSGPVQIFVAKNFELSNGVSLGDPEDRAGLLQLYLGSGVTYNQSGGSTLTGVVYAPGNSIRMSNAATVYGAVVGGDVVLEGSAHVTYDETLSDLTLTGTGSGSGTATQTVLFRERY